MTVKITSEGPKKLCRMCQNCGRFISINDEGNIDPHINLMTGDPCIKTEMAINEFYDYMKSIMDNFVVMWLQNKDTYPKVLEVPEWMEQLDTFIDMESS